MFYIFLFVCRFRTNTIRFSGDACLLFALSMFGEDNGFLIVKKCNTNSCKTVYKEGGYSYIDASERVSLWETRTVTISVEDRDYVSDDWRHVTGIMWGN